MNDHLDSAVQSSAASIKSGYVGRLVVIMDLCDTDTVRTVIQHGLCAFVKIGGPFLLNKESALGLNYLSCVKTISNKVTQC